VLIIRRANCINTASAMLPSVSDRPVCRLKRELLNLHTGRSLTDGNIVVPTQQRERMVVDPVNQYQKL